MICHCIKLFNVVNFQFKRQIRKPCENETSKNWISRFPVFSFVWEVVSNWVIWQENKKWFSWQTAYIETSSLKMIRLRLGLILFFAISSSFGQNQGLIDENSLDLALRNVIQYIESGSNSLYAYKVGHVRIFSICNLHKYLHFLGKILRHHFYLPEANVKVQNGYGVLGRLVSCI